MKNKVSSKYLLMVLGPLGIGFFQISESSKMNDGIGLALLIINLALLYLYYLEIKNKKNENQINTQLLNNLEYDIEFRQLLSDRKRVKAIKRCRVITGCDLLTAKEYVDSKI